MQYFYKHLNVVFWVVCFWIEGVSGLFAQHDHAVFKKISYEQGLSQSTVSAIVQDRFGYIWFGSRNGLNRYDGYGIKVYKNHAFDSTSISDNWITSLYLDKDGRLWIGTLNRGLNYFDALTEKARHYEYQAGNPEGIPNNRVQTIAGDHEGNLWVGTANGLAKFQSNRFTSFYHEKTNPLSLPDNMVTALLCDRKGNIWIGTARGLVLNNGNEFIRVEMSLRENTHPAIQNLRITALTEDSLGFIWAGTEKNGVYKIAPVHPVPQMMNHYNQTLKYESGLSSNEILSLYTDKNGSVWIGTMNGLNRYDARSGRFTRFYHDADDPNSLSNNEIRSIYQDQSGILWIGTYGGGGVNKMDLKPAKFHHYHYEPKKSGSLSDDVVRCFLKDRSGRLWVGTHFGLNYFFEETNEFVTYRHQPDNPLSISHDEVRSLYEDGDGILWIGTEAGLNRLDLNAKGKVVFKRYPAKPEDPSGLSHPHVFSIYEDKEKKLWLGTNGGGVNIFDKKTEKFKPIRFERNNPNSISSDYISIIYGDQHGTIWVGTFGGGLNRIQSADNGRLFFKNFRNQPNDTTTLSSDVVYTIKEDRQGRLWIGTNTGLNLMNREKETFSLVDIRDGLPDNYIYGILEDAEGYLWLSSVGGLTRYHPDTKTVRNYDVMDGLQSNEFKFGSYYRAADGEMFFGGVNGFNRFYPHQVRDNSYEPPVVITAFRREGAGSSRTEDQQMLIKGFVDIAWGENFYFEFSSLDYTCPSKNQYAYRLKGYDENWVYCGNRRFASYTHLDGGDYLFEVRGTNSDGVWSSSIASLPLHIRPPFWQTWWFRIAVVLLVILAAFVGYEWRLRAVRHYNEVLEKKVRERTQKLQETQHQLIQSEKISAVGRMVAGITHEINNPLAFVIGNLSIFKEYVERLIQSVEQIRQRTDKGEKLDADDIRQILETHEYSVIQNDVFASMQSCQKGAERIRNLIRNLRDFSILGERDLISTNINDEIMNVIYQLKEKSGNRITIEEHFGLIPQIECFPSLLRLVFTNILTNAIEAIDDTGTITITTETWDNKAIRISIKDTGKGMSVDTLSKIYDPFFTTKSFGQGTGLGLSISYGIIKTHKGDIDVKSQLGKGTEFIITLPVHFLKETENED